MKASKVHRSDERENKRSMIASWQRFGINCVPAAKKEEIFQCINNVILATKACEKKIFFQIGSNNVSKLLEGDRCIGIVICRDAPAVLHNHIVEAAVLRHIPIVLIPKAMMEMSRILSLKKSSVFGIVKQSRQQNKETSIPTKNEEGLEGTNAASKNYNNDDAIDAALDSLMDCIRSTVAKEL